MNKLRPTVIILLILSLIALTACSVQKISDIKKDSLIDNDVTVKGTVEGSTKIGTFSGYTVKDDTGSIGVVSKTLPADGSTITVKGKLKKFLTVYYIDANE